jgi:NAD+ diphosphatase
MQAMACKELIRRSLFMEFIPGHIPPSVATQTPMWFVFRANKILVKQVVDSVIKPYISDPKKLNLGLLRQQFLGLLDGIPCFAAELAGDNTLPEGIALHGLRELLGVVNDELFAVAGHANQIIHWDQTHLYCGRCGDPTRDKKDERAKICFSCGLINYPRVTPAIIVAVIRGETILLARSTRFRSNLYSVLAGFVEPGENLEDCVEREIKEEVSLAVQNIRYFGSQPWPFPNSLMVGFTAEYMGGEISVDASEIIHADWFSNRNLPQIPGNQTIARQLIDWFLKTHT